MTVNEPLVSIGIPVYNGSKYIMETLDSINNQEYSNIELLIIDDGSHDDSFELCNRWKQHSRWPVSIQKNEVNLGLTKTCNILLNKAKGKYLQLFGQDDIMLSQKIKDDVKLFEKLNEDVALIYSKVKLIDSKGELLQQEYNDRIGFDGILRENCFAQLIWSNFIPAPTVMMRTDLAKTIGGYDETLLFEDWDMWLRLARDYKIAFVDFTNVYYRIHAESMMANNDDKQQIDRNNATIKMIKKQLDLRKDDNELFYDKLRQLSIYSYFLGDKNSAKNFSWYLQKKFDSKIWLYHKLSSVGVVHPSKLVKRFFKKL